MPSKPKLADPGALIRNGKPRTDDYRVCLDPDLVSEYERLVVARDAAKEAARDSLAGGTVVELDAEIAALLEQMQDVTVTLVLKSLPRPVFRAIIDRHPAHKDDDGKIDRALDGLFGVGFDGFFAEAIPVSLVSPVLDPETLSILLDEQFSDQQYIDLAIKCWHLNKTSVDVPFSSAVSPRTRRSSGK